MILSGGVGSRLWPLSRKKYPKPFIAPVGGRTTLLQNTVMRAAALPSVHDIVTVTGRDLLLETRTQYQALAPASCHRIRQHFILEPSGRNTAAAIAVACIWAHKTHGDEAMLLVLPADHVISDEASLAAAVHQAARIAADHKLVTFGITPAKAKSAYGYIEHAADKVLRFIEKPSPEKAREYLQQGCFLWNSGMFCFTAGTMLNELALHCADIFAACQQCMTVAAQLSAPDGGTQIELEPAGYAAVRAESIDYAVMEHTLNAAVVPCNLGWDDVGDWGAFGDLQPPDPARNRLHGDVIAHASHGCTIHAAASRVVAAVGLQDTIVIDTDDALLVLNKADAQDVRQIYNALEQRCHPTHVRHRTIGYAWGRYTVLDSGADFKVGRLTLWGEQEVSLQLPAACAAHWTVVHGIAAVTLHGGAELRLRASQSVALKSGQLHRLRNLQTQPLMVIEVQTGDDLTEDAIVYDSANVPSPQKRASIQ